MNRKVYLFLGILSFLFLSCGGGGGDSSPTPPPAPENVVSIGGNAQVRLSWGDVSGATSYNIYWSTTAGAVKSTGTKISGATSPYYQDGLSNGTIYYYVVTAANQHGESVESREASVMPSQLAPPLPPKEVMAFGNNREVLIRWTTAETNDATASNNIYWSMYSGVTKRNGTKITDTVSPYTHDDLSNGMTYYYVVTSVNVYGESLESEEVSATPEQGNVPSAPTGIRAVAGDRQAVLSWNAVEDSQIYNIYWSTSQDVSRLNGTKLADVKSPHTHSALGQGVTYYYVITSQNGFGESDDSERISVTIPDMHNDICVALGDSITVGARATNVSNSYVALLSARWGKEIKNEGVGGVYSSYAAFMIDHFLSLYNPRYITIFFGATDSGQMQPDATISNLQYIIEKAKNNGTIPVIATAGPVFGSQWGWKKDYIIDLNRRIRQLATSEGIACVDIESAMDWNESYMDSDGLHPNDTGHRIIADTFYQVLTR
jgi:lysophospholipase L1-like esterase/fibronectin type 3 domain-containing protein